MSIEEAIAKHAEAMEKLAAALTLKAEADLKARRRLPRSQRRGSNLRARKKLRTRTPR